MRYTLFIILLLSVIQSGCREILSKRVRGNGNIVTESRSISGFDGIDVSGAILVRLSPDSSSGVRIETDANLTEYIVTDVVGNTLKIHSRRSANLRPTRKITVYVAANNLDHFEASGACEIISDQKITHAESIEIDLTGASKANIELNAPKVNASLTGASKIELRGETKDVRLSGTGASEFDCFQLMAETVSVGISGAGDADVFASKSIDVRVSGAGTVNYKGNPSVSQNVTGAGRVQKAD